MYIKKKRYYVEFVEYVVIIIRILLPTSYNYICYSMFCSIHVVFFCCFLSFYFVFCGYVCVETTVSFCFRLLHCTETYKFDEHVRECYMYILLLPDPSVIVYKKLSYG